MKSETHVPIWVAYSAFEVAEWLRSNLQHDHEYEAFVRDIMIPVLGPPPYVEVFYENMEVPDFVEDLSLPQIEFEFDGGYFTGNVGTVNGKPAILGGFGCSGSAAPHSVFMHLEHWADLPPAPENE